MNKLLCSACKKIFDWDMRAHAIGRQDRCPSCQADLKVCLNCTHYDRSAQWECRESISEAVREKDRANFCGEFQYHSAVSGGGPVGPQKEDLLKNAEALFKKLK